MEALCVLSLFLRVMKSFTEIMILRILQLHILPSQGFTEKPSYCMTEAATNLTQTYCKSTPLDISHLLRALVY